MGIGYLNVDPVQQVDGTANTTGTAASMIAPHARIPIRANYFDTPGKGIIIRAAGRISSVITTPGTARYDIRFGSAVVFDGLAILLDTVAGHTNVAWDLEVRLVARSPVGAATQLWGIGKWWCEDILGVPATAPKGVLCAMLPWNTAPALGAAFDSSVAQTVDAFFTQTAATGSHTCHMFDVQLLNS